MAYKGIFSPRNPKKYAGDATNIIYRSRWELKLMDKLDRHPQVTKWASEEMVVPYISPVDNRRHRYFPDFVVEMDVEGKKQIKMIEVKPLAQCKPPKPKMTKTGKPTRRMINEQKTYAVNQAKWHAAREYCAKHGWEFVIMTERELGITF